MIAWWRRTGIETLAFALVLTLVIALVLYTQHSPHIEGTP